MPLSLPFDQVSGAKVIVKGVIADIWTDDPEKDEIVHVRRRQSRSIEKRARILAAAAQEFADRGFDGATTRSIADRAEVRHALVIYHFETKLGIWQAVMRDVFHWFKDAFAERIESLTGLDDVIRLQSLQADFIRLAARHPEFHWLMSHEAGHGGERLDWLLENLLQDSFEMFRTLIRNVQAMGRYVQGDPDHLHYLFIGAAARIFMLSSEVKLVIGRSPFEPDFVEEHIRLCQELFFRGGTQTQPPTEPKKRARTTA